VGGDGDQVVVADLVGQELVSDWLEIAQARIDEFARATDDRQWIHTDPARAAEGPFGTTIAHGFLTLSLVVPLFEQAMPAVEGYRLTVNYGLNRVRFTAPVASGTRVRGRFRIEGVEEVPGGEQLTVSVTIEREGEEKPARVAETLFRFLR
jgi:acyl dehydratase